MSIRSNRLNNRNTITNTRINSLVAAFEIYKDEHGCYPNLAEDGLKAISGGQYAEIYRHRTGDDVVPVVDGYGQSLYVMYNSRGATIGTVSSGGTAESSPDSNVAIAELVCDFVEGCVCGGDVSDGVVELKGLVSR